MKRFYPLPNEDFSWAGVAYNRQWKGYWVSANKLLTEITSPSRQVA